MRSRYLPVIALGASLLAAGAAQATIITGTGTFADNGPNTNAVTFTGVTDNSLITGLNLSVGMPVTLDNFLTISTADTTGSFFGTSATDNIAENFSFTQPGTASGSLSGSGSETVVSFFGTIVGDGGKVSWDNPLTLDFTDGAQLQISLQNTAFLCVLDCNGSQSVGVDATVNLVKDPTVPEPGTLALMALGLAGVGVTLARRRRDSI